MRRGGLSELMTALILVAGVVAATSTVAQAGTLSGSAYIPKVLGQSQGNLELYEWNIWVSRDGGLETGQHFRVGLPPNPRDYFGWTVSGGRYSLFLDQPLFWGRPAVVLDVNVPVSGNNWVAAVPPLDYSCAFGDKSAAWGDNPWTPWRPVWYQTFIATGSSITGINFKLAGQNASTMGISIRQDNGGDITTWPQVGVSRIKYGLGGGDQWIRLRSGQIPTVPGLRYALKLTGMNGSPNNEFSIYRRSEDGQGYALGQAFDSGGAPYDCDLYANVFSDNNGTVVPYCSLEYDGGALAGWAGTWSQRIRAQGTSLAGAVIYFAGGDTWDKMATFRVRTGGPNGTQVGPQKTSRSGYQAATSGMVAASWNPDEVPLAPGQDYYIEIATEGFNPSSFTSSINAYPYGEAYQSGGIQPDKDLHMQVVEYDDEALPDPPVLYRFPFTINLEIHRGSNPVDGHFIVRNDGEGLMAYTVADNANWLAVSPDSGESAGESDTITVSYDVEDKAIGSYTGIITIHAPGATNPTETVVVYLNVIEPEFAPCDFDEDHDVDQVDFGYFQSCFSGSGNAQTAPACSGARLDGDDDVDQDDYGVFQGCLSGPGQPADVLCAD